MLKRLPTFTRTPLPPLTLVTPTGASVALAVEATTVSFVASPPLSDKTLPLSNTIPPIVEPESTIIIAQAPSTAVNPVTTNLDFIVTATALSGSSTNLPTNESSPISVSTGLPVATITTSPSPTPSPTNVVVTPTPSPTDLPTTTPTATSTPTASPTATSTPQEWAFSGVRIYNDQYEGGLLLYGNATNNTGVAQEISDLSGAFYNAQNQVISAADQIYTYWPGYVIPAGATFPFEMVVENITDPADYDLTVEAEPSDELPRQDFEISEINQESYEETYCVEGQLGNRQTELVDYITVALILYDAQNNVISFTDYEEFSPDWVIGDDLLDYELCADLLDQTVARHSIVAWGR